MNSNPLSNQIYRKYHLGPANRMTHIENLDLIFREGAFVAKNAAGTHPYVSLANPNVVARRAEIKLKATGRSLHDYVPLYFGNRTPMVAWNQKRNEEVVFLRFLLELLPMGGVVISDGNARSHTTQFRIYSTLSDLDILDVHAINTVKYAHDADLKRRKQAEILVPDRLPFTHLIDIICYSKEAQTRVLEITKQHGMSCPVQVLPGSWYFNTPAEKGGEKS